MVSERYRVDEDEDSATESDFVINEDEVLSHDQEKEVFTAIDSSSAKQRSRRLNCNYQLRIHQTEHSIRIVHRRRYSMQKLSSFFKNFEIDDYTDHNDPTPFLFNHMQKIEEQNRNYDVTIGESQPSNSLENLDRLNQEVEVEEKLQKVDEETLNQHFKKFLSAIDHSVNVIIRHDPISTKLESVSEGFGIDLEVMKSHFLSVSLSIANHFGYLDQHCDFITVFVPGCFDVPHQDAS